MKIGVWFLHFFDPHLFHNAANELPASIVGRCPILLVFEFGFMVGICLLISTTVAVSVMVEPH